MVDLDINYADDNDKNPLQKICGYLRRRRLHKKRFTDLLMRERPDIVDSLYPCESSFFMDIKDGSKKVLELHINKFFRLQYNRGGLIGLIDKWRTKQDEKICSRFDRFVVLTNEDKGYWGDMPNIRVIPNAAMMMSDRCSDVSAKRFIAVGRLDYQKSFDRLVQAWEIVQKLGDYKEWTLDIFGQGEWQEMLQEMIDKAGIGDTIRLNKPTKTIGEEYAKSAALVMSSHYEGLPMVMIEAMACGLPVVSFDFKCGPKDIIVDGENGLIVRDGDLDGLAKAMIKIMEDGEMRRRMSAEALLITEKYSEKRVMEQWTQLYEELTHEKTAAN